MGGILAEVLSGIGAAVKLWQDGNEEDRKAAEAKMLAVRDTLLRPAKVETADEHAVALAETQKAIADAQEKFDTSDAVPEVIK